MPTSDDLLALFVTQTWQVAVVAAIVWLIVRWFGKSQPHMSHCLWALVLLKCLTPPIWSSPFGVFNWMESRLSNPMQLSSDLQPTESILKVHPSGFASTVRSAISTRSPLPSSVNFDVTELDLPWTWQQWLCVLWLCGSGCILSMAVLRLVLFWRWVSKQNSQKLLTNSNDIETSLQIATQALAKKLGMRRRVRICVLDAKLVPAVFGLMRPTIVLPAVIVNHKSLRALLPVGSSVILASGAPTNLTGNDNVLVVMASCEIIDSVEKNASQR